jgi:hypothetical protein
MKKRVLLRVSSSRPARARWLACHDATVPQRASDVLGRAYRLKTSLGTAPYAGVRFFYNSEHLPTGGMMGVFSMCLKIKVEYFVGMTPAYSLGRSLAGEQSVKSALGRSKLATAPVTQGLLICCQGRVDRGAFRVAPLVAPSDAKLSSQTSLQTVTGTD